MTGTGDGVNLWEEKNQRFISFKSDKNEPNSLIGKTVQDVHQSRDGKIWIATQMGLKYASKSSTSILKQISNLNKF